MSTKHILGLDLGTNSIGWAVVKSNDTETQQCVLSGIVDAGSRIIPMDAAMQSDFAKGNTISQTKDRTQYRGTRRLRERYLLRRERLHRVLLQMGFLPLHYANSLTRYGKFKDGAECKLPWEKIEGGEIQRFLFKDHMMRCCKCFGPLSPN